MVEKPHVLFIHLDQLRWDCLSVYGNKQIQTPHIESLSEEALTYENHFCSYPVCTPSRYSLLSGLDVQDHRGWNNHCTLKTDIPTWPRELRESGYRTTAVGKMHFTPTYLDVGFDKMILSEQDGPGRWDDDYHLELMERGLIDAMDIMDQRREYRDQAEEEYWESKGTAGNNLPEELASTGWITKKALGELESWTDDPACLMVGYIKPHHPFDPPPPWDSMYDWEDMELLPGWTEQPSEEDLEFHKGYFPHDELTRESLKKVQAAYYACISEIDKAVGDMLGILRKKGLYDKTLIILTSDHGDYMGYHHLLLKGNHMYDPLMRIPLIIKQPGQIRGGRSHALCSNGDLKNHIMALCLETKSRGEAAIVPRDCVFAHSNEGRMAMARTVNYKLLKNNGTGEIRFFDLRKDPWELNDVAGLKQYGEIKSELLDKLENWQGAGYSQGQEAYLNEDEATSRDMGDLGLTRQKRKLYYKEAFEKHLGSRGKRNEQQKPYPHHTR